MILQNIRLAVQSMKRARVRSFLTMLGIVIGVASVVTIFSIGEGVKNQLIGQADRLGDNLLVVRSGPMRTSAEQTVTELLGRSSYMIPSLSITDVNDVAQLKGVIASAAPLATIANGLESNEDQPQKVMAPVVATNEQLPSILQFRMSAGAFFFADDSERNAIVLGHDVQQKLFGIDTAVGKIVRIRGSDFVVRGSLAEYDKAPLHIGLDYDTAVYIPVGTAAKLTGSPLMIQEIVALTADGVPTSEARDKVQRELAENHQTDQDFQVLEKDAHIDESKKLFTGLTTATSTIAAISLLVGGIGIMNIMLVGVSERTREIGVRKAIGATSGQILHQFLIESIVLSTFGGVIGVLLSFATTYFVTLFTTIQPSISIPVIAIATGTALLTGIIFGITPAYKAARKDPIESLRHI